jgi:glutamate-1-semialdehyde 2,1-aminomutase
MAAGLAAMDAYGQEEIDRLNKLGDRLRNGIRSVMDTIGIEGQVTGLGSVMEMVFSNAEMNNCKDVMLAAIATNDLCRYLHLDLTNHGVFYTPRGMISLSTPMTETDIDEAIDLIGNSIEKVRPLINP